MPATCHHSVTNETSYVLVLETRSLLLDKVAGERQKGCKCRYSLFSILCTVPRSWASADHTNGLLCLQHPLGFGHERHCQETVSCLCQGLEPHVYSDAVSPAF